MITKIDNYYLDQPIGDTHDLMEFTAEEYSAFEIAGTKRILKDEKIYHGHDVSFANSVYKSWNTMIGSTEGKVYKISIQQVVSDKDESNPWFHKTLDYLVKEMGKYNKHPLFSKMYVWDKPEGNVILHQVNKFGFCSTNLFLTSSLIRKQM